MLSKYNGNGSDTIDIIFYEDTEVASGTVYFSFGNEECEFTGIPIYVTNNCIIETIPSYRKCCDENGKNCKKIIYFYFSEPKETFTISVRCFNGWNVESTVANYIMGNGEFMVIAPDNADEAELVIKTNNQCNGSDAIYVKLIKKSD